MYWGLHQRVGTNIHKPAAYRAHYPLRIAAFAGLRDWDGVFWYDWSNGTVLDQVDGEVYAVTGLRYSAPAHIWHGIVSCTDEILLASMRIAGEMFRHGTIPVMPRPVTVTVGANDLLGRRSWIDDITLPFPPEAALPYPRASALAATDFLRGCRFRYALDVATTTATDALQAKTPSQVAPGPGIACDFEKGTLAFDLPSAKVVVGLARDGLAFNDGVELGPGNREFVCFGLVSTDGLPLAESEDAVLVLCSMGENVGMRKTDKPEERGPKTVSVHARIVTSWGYGGPELERVAATLRLGRTWQWTLRDFALRAFRRGTGDTLRVTADDPLFWAELRSP